jgi:hypothetical protein
MIKSRRNSWVRHAACIGEMRNEYKILVGMPKKERDHSEGRGIDNGMILKWVLGTKCTRVQTGFFWLRTGTDGGSCEEGEDLSRSTTGR